MLILALACAGHAPVAAAPPPAPLAPPVWTASSVTRLDDFGGWPVRCTADRHVVTVVSASGDATLRRWRRDGEEVARLPIAEPGTAGWGAPWDAFWVHHWVRKEDRARWGVVVKSAEPIRRYDLTPALVAEPKFDRWVHSSDVLSASADGRVVAARPHASRAVVFRDGVRLGDPGGETMEVSPDGSAVLVDGDRVLRVAPGLPQDWALDDRRIPDPDSESFGTWSFDGSRLLLVNVSRGRALVAEADAWDGAVSWVVESPRRIDDIAPLGPRSWVVASDHRVGVLEAGRWTWTSAPLDASVTHVAPCGTRGEAFATRSHDGGVGVWVRE